MAVWLSSLPVSTRAQSDPGVPEVRAVVEQYQSVLEAHADIICEYTFTTHEARSVDDVFTHAWIPGSPKYTSRGIYMSRAGKVRASEYSLDEPVVSEEQKTMSGATTEFLTDGNWRTLRECNFGILALGRRGHFKNERWGPCFTPWSFAVMGSTRHTPGTENLGAYRHIMENIGSTKVTTDSASIDAAHDGVPETALRVTVTSGEGTGTRRYYFTTPAEYDVPMLSMFELYAADNDRQPHTVAHVTEFGVSPYELPFPVKCVRISYPTSPEGVYTAVLTEVTRLEKPTNVSDEAFHLDLKAGEQVVLEDSGISLRLQKDLVLGIDTMPTLEQQIYQKYDDLARGSEIADRKIASHRTNFVLLLTANIVLAVVTGTLLWRRRRQIVAMNPSERSASAVEQR
ncbi:MAG: hypothetical protein M3552_17630 [Planctomycetota bacterium]|nr:hypothetical protein [Planctomycetaceae bacterium]MDQ3332441.1 hypothetical protein [Planctomycetota bacterium]